MKVRLQRDFKDCGVTCLSYLIAHYGGYVPIEQLREDTNTTQYGVTAYDLVETLKKYHFDSFGVRISYEELSAFHFPAIAHVILEQGLEHFVIVTKVTSRSVSLMDPAAGKRKLTKTEFLEIWDGVLLTAVPNQLIPKLQKGKSVLRILFDILGQEKKIFCKLIFFQFFVALLTILVSFYLKIGMQALVSYDLKPFWVLSFVFFAFYLIRFFLSLGTESLKNYFRKDVGIVYMDQFLRHLLSIPLQKFSSYHMGEILTRVEEAEEIQELFLEVCVSFFLQLLLGVSTVAFLYFLEPTLFLILLIGILFYVLFGIFFGKYLYKIVLQRLELDTKWKTSFIQTLQMYPTTKHLNQTLFEMKRVENVLGEVSVKKLKFSQKVVVLQSLKEHYLEILFFGISVYGLHQILLGQLALVDFVTFQNLYMYFVRPLRNLVETIPKFCYMKGILEKISEYLQIKEEALEEDADTLCFSSLEFQNVSYSYHSVQPVFDHFSYKITKKHNFVKGASGSGKSTLCRLLLREIKADEGKILLNGKNIYDYSLGEIRKNIVYLSQKENLFTGTIRENILFGRKVSQDVFDQVCEVCCLEGVVEKKALRYETTIDETTLSGGEKQRVMLARTLLSDASLYLFDEALSEVDADCEKEIIKALRGYLKDKMILYISHRNHSRLFQEVVDVGKSEV